MANYTLKVFSRGTVAARERGRFHSPVLATSDIRSKTMKNQLCRNPYRLLHDV
jgi:hypothetical protein